MGSGFILKLERKTTAVPAGQPASQISLRTRDWRLFCMTTCSSPPFLPIVKKTHTHRHTRGKKDATYLARLHEEIPAPREFLRLVITIYRHKKKMFYRDVSAIPSSSKRSRQRGRKERREGHGLTASRTNTRQRGGGGLIDWSRNFWRFAVHRLQKTCLRPLVRLLIGYIDV